MINNTQIDNTKDNDVVKPVYSLIEYSDNYSKTSGRFWQCHRDEPALSDASAVDNFPGNSTLFKFKQNITGATGNDGTKNIEIMVPLKYLSNFSRILEIPLINCGINLIQTWSNSCVICNGDADQTATFSITTTKLYVPLVVLSTDDNGKLLQQLKSSFKHTINWNKYQSKTTIQAPN